MLKGITISKAHRMHSFPRVAVDAGPEQRWRQMIRSALLQRESKNGSLFVSEILFSFKGVIICIKYFHRFIMYVITICVCTICVCTIYVCNI